MENMIKVANYEDFIPEDKVYQFECDMEDGKYEEWIDEYPEHILSIFGSFLTFGGTSVTEADIVYFLNEGIDINVISDAYPCEEEFTTALNFACEHRNMHLIYYLIQHGADVNKMNTSKITPLEAALMGHGMLDLEKFDEAEKCVKMLLDAGATNQLRKFILEDFCEDYMKNSLYLKDVLTNSKLL